MALVGHRSPRNTRQFRSALSARLALLPNFPKGAEISYKGHDDSLGTVMDYDRDIGRVLTKIGSFDPHDIKVLPPK